jgi:hypothetical protein
MTMHNGNTVSFFNISLEMDKLVIGERVKGGVFRPCITVIPSTTVRGMFHAIGMDDIIGVGIISDKTYEIAYHIYSPRDRYVNSSKIPILTQYIKPKNDKGKIKATIYVPHNENHRNVIYNLKNKELIMGALKSKGFGRCKVVDVKECVYAIDKGILNVRLLEDECKHFKLRVLAGRYGYLFKPDRYHINGSYKKAILEGSIVEGPVNLLKERTGYYEYG